MQPVQLILQLQNGNEKAFQKIYDMYSENILGVIYTIVQDKTQSEEVMQDVFMKIWNNASSYSEKKGRFFTWILNIARNTAIDKVRSKSYNNDKKNQTIDSFVNIFESKDNISENTNSIDIKNYIKQLEENCKKIIDLLFFKGYTQKEASEELSTPLGTIKTRSRNCINQLRKALNV